MKHDYPRILHEQLHGRYKGQDEDDMVYFSKVSDPTSWTDNTCGSIRFPFNVEKFMRRSKFNTWLILQIIRPIIWWQRIVKWWKHEMLWARWF